MNQSVIIGTFTIVHLGIEVSVIKNVADIPRIIPNFKKYVKLLREKQFIAVTDHDYILDEIEFHDYIEYERQIQNGDK